MKMDLLRLQENDAIERLRALGFADPASALNNLRRLARTPFNDKLGELIVLSGKAPSPDACLNNLERATKEAPDKTLTESLEDPATLSSLVRLCGSSNYLANILLRDPALYGWLFVEGGLDLSKDEPAFRDELRAAMESEGIEAGDVNRAMKALRVHRQKEYLRIGARDLLGLSGVESTTAELADLASASLDAAVDFAVKTLKKSFGEPVFTDEDGPALEAGFAVIGLGKLGGRDLNFSSDIDIIYVYSSEKGETAGVENRAESRISLHAFFTKAAALVNRLIGAVTEDGFVFRVDLDLRPEGRSGDMCAPLRSMEIYYESWGQMWERAAYIKARPVAGDKALGEEFLAMIRPFVYRRYMDFTAIEEIKAMKEKIDLSLLKKSPDTVDVKLGIGGIREIEFFCQALQLIHAGKDPTLRERNTLSAIEKLRQRGLVKEEEAASLAGGYRFLRDLEHRIQIVEGLQTQAIPATERELERLARMMGFEDSPERSAGRTFWEKYREKTAAVHEIYRSLFYKEDELKDIPGEVLSLLAPDSSEEEASSMLAALGFRDPAVASANIALLRGIASRARLSGRGRVVVQKLLPLFIDAASKAPDPDMALGHLERFTASVGLRTSFYSLLLENRPIIEELLKLFGTSVFLSRALIERPESLEILLSKELSVPYKKRNGFLTELDADADYEEALDMLRRLKNQELFRIGVNDIRGALTPRQVSVQITFLAEAALEAALRISCLALERRFGAPEGARFCVLGMGRLGAAELLYGSDLDVVFVYDGDEDRLTRGGITPVGPHEITNHEFFVKLGARIISVLTLKTKDGSVFSIDARLRPSGSSGPLVVSRAALLKYHGGSTSVWERQAWLRARPVAGDVAAGLDMLKELDGVIFTRPLTGEDALDMLRIRKRMETEIAKEDGARFNIKTGAGGMVDVEFLIQALQLENYEDRSLRTPSTMKALGRLVKKGLLPGQDGTLLKEAYWFYRLLELRQRVVHDRPEGYLYKDSPETETLARRCGYAEAGGVLPRSPGKRLIADYEGYAARIRSLYLSTLEAAAKK